MERARKFVVANLWWIVLLIAVALLVSHTFGVQRVAVSTTPRHLLLILISPFVAAINA